MEMDKIISDLVKVRLKEELRSCVRNTLNSHSDVQDSLRNLIKDIANECVTEFRPDLKKAISESFKKMFIEGNAVGNVNCRIDFDVSDYDIEATFNRLQKEREELKKRMK